jgi:N,N'-diacetyllegionaminate synthase
MNYPDFKKNFIVAEIGINHNGDMGLAKETIISAAEAGADSVKFQNYKIKDFISDKNLIFEYQSMGKKVIESQYDMFKRCELSRDQLALLKEQADSLGINFHSTPTSIEGIEDLKTIGCKIIKNGSDFLTNLKLIRAMGETGLLTVLSTGMSTISEIRDAVNTFKKTGNTNLVLLQCTSAYPTEPEEVNLARINTLRSQFNANVGFSDHTKGIIAAVGAVLFKSIWIEKHFTLDKTLPGPDHWFSSDPSEFKELVNAVRYAEKLIGSDEILPTKSEKISRKEFRLSCVASRDLKSGSCVTVDDIEFRRPGDGMPPSLENFLIGKKINYSIKKGQQFKKEYFDD